VFSHLCEIMLQLRCEIPVRASVEAKHDSYKDAVSPLPIYINVTSWVIAE